MQTFITEIDILRDLKNTLERYCSNGSDILWSIDSNIQSKLDELKSYESYFSSKVREAESELNNAETALSDCESQYADDDEDGTGDSPDCSIFESEVSDCKRRLEEAHQRLQAFQQQIQRLEDEVDRYQNAKFRFQSSLQYHKDSTSTRLLAIISRLEAYVSYTLIPSFSTSSVSSSDRNKSINYVYKEFRNTNEAFNWGYSEHSWGKLWVASLSKEQKESLNRYKQYDYIGINDYLRYGGFSMAAHGSQYYFNRIKSDIGNIDKALNSSIIPENIVTYRGFVDFECKTGDIVPQKAYESTSLSYDSALHFANKVINSGNKGAVAKIYIAKGKKGAFMDGVSFIPEDGNEILLPRNTIYKVLSVKWMKGIKHLELEVL